MQPETIRYGFHFRLFFPKMFRILFVCSTVSICLFAFFIRHTYTHTQRRIYLEYFSSVSATNHSTTNQQPENKKHTHTHQVTFQRMFMDKFCLFELFARCFFVRRDVLLSFGVWKFSSLQSILKCPQNATCRIALQLVDHTHTHTNKRIESRLFHVVDV